MPPDSFLVQNLPLLVAIAAAAALIAAICALILVLRRGQVGVVESMRDRLIALELGVKHADNAVRDEIARVRTEAEDRGGKLRDGLTLQVTTLGDSIGGRVEESRRTVDQRLTNFAKETTENADRLQFAVKQAVAGFGEVLNTRIVDLSTGLNERIGGFTDSQAKRQTDFQTSTAEALQRVEQRVAALTAENEQRQIALRAMVEERLEQLRAGNDAKLEQMRQTVDEKLQGTLEKRLGESFALVSERLENVQRGLGEMQTLALGVGDLKKVLSNVKDRGGWAEIQLGMLLEDMLTRDQFDTNVAIDPSSSERVEYVVRLPGQDAESEVWLPIDAKFPKEDYERLIDAMQVGDATAIRVAQADLARVIESEAKKIASKYIREPRTTNFAIMYLPTEGLFAEALRYPGLSAKLQSQHRVTVAGPTTLSALLNSLQMGFRTLHIQKRSSEVWKVLGEAKSEFEKYGAVWDKLKKQLETAQNTVEEAGKRTRAVTRRLRDVTAIEGSVASLPILELTADEDAES